MATTAFYQSLKHSTEDFVDSVVHIKPYGEQERLAIEQLHALGLESAEVSDYHYFRFSHDARKQIPYHLHKTFQDVVQESFPAYRDKNPILKLRPAEGIGDAVLEILGKLTAGTLEPLPPLDAQHVEAAPAPTEATPKKEDARPDEADGNTPGQAEHPAPAPQVPATIPDAPQKEQSEPRQEKRTVTEPPARAVAMKNRSARRKDVITDVGVVFAEARRQMERDFGICVDGPIVADGEWNRFKTLREVEKGRHGEKSGSYLAHADGIPVVLFWNWQQQHLGLGKVTGADKDLVDSIKKTHPEAIQKRTQADVDELDRRIEEARRKAEAERAKAAEEAARKARYIYDKASEDVSRCPYLQRKGVLPTTGTTIPGLRCTADGTLLIPLRRAGEFAGVQMVFPDEKGTKRPVKGTQMGGVSFLLAGTADHTKVFLAEGIATALSIWMATGASVLTCFNCGNLPKVAEEIKAGRIPEVQDKTVAVACDNDSYGDELGRDGKSRNPGVEDGMKAARILGCGMYIPFFRDVSGKPTDYNDLHAQGGVEAVRAQLAAEPLSPDAVKKEMERPCAVGEIRVGSGKMFDAILASPSARQKLVSEVKRLEQEHLDRMKVSTASPAEATEECLRALAPYAWTKLLDKEVILADCRAVLEASGVENAMETVAALWRKYESTRYAEPVISLAESDGVKLPVQVVPEAPATAGEAPFELAPETVALEDYPLFALSDDARGWVDAVAQAKQAHPMLIANQLLGLMSGVAQDHADVIPKLDSGVGSAPLSLFCVSVAPTSEGKTVTEKALTGGVVEYEREADEVFEQEKREYQIQKTIYEGKMNKLRRAAEKGEVDMSSLPEEPARPIDGSFTFTEGTTQGLAKAMQYNRRSVMLINDEGGQLLRGYNLTGEQRSQALGFWCGLWSGKDVVVRLAGGEKDGVKIALRGRRVAWSLCVQPYLIPELMKEDMRVSGLAPRLLLVNVPKLKDRASPIAGVVDTRKLREFYRKTKDMLSSEPYLDEAGNRPLLTLDDEACELYDQEFHALRQETSSGVFDGCPELAGKVLENALRIAGVFTVWEKGAVYECGFSQWCPNKIDVETLRRAITLARWYGRQSAKIFADRVDASVEADAKAVMEIIHARRVTCTEERGYIVRDIAKSTRRFNTKEGMARVRRACDLLCEYGVLEPIATKRVGKGEKMIDLAIGYTLISRD